MNRVCYSANIRVPKYGEVNPDEYVGMPLIKNGEIIGIIRECYSVGEEVVMKLDLWQSIQLVFKEDKPTYFSLH